MRREALDVLGGVADLKNRQIANWMKERTSDAHALVADPLFQAGVERWLGQGGRSGKASADLAMRLSSLQHAYDDFTAISLFDAQGKLRLSSVPDERPSSAEVDDLLHSMRAGHIEFSDIHREGGGPDQKVELEIRAPLIAPGIGKARVLGVVLFRIDPSLFLFPLIQRWPTPSKSAETVLVRREGNEVVFLNTLRHVGNSPLAMRRPLDDRALLAAKAARGEEGLAEGLDYRGIPVVGILSRVAGSPWHMVTKIDEAEVYAPIDQLAGWIEVLTLTLVGAGAGIAVYWLRGERRQHRQELERQALRKHLSYVTRFSNDAIVLVDGKGRVVDFNDRALSMYGYAPEAFSRLTLDDLRAPEFTPTTPQRLGMIDSAGGASLFETTHRRSNGERFPVEVSVRRIDIAGEKFYQGIQRDITERKKAEDMLRFHSQILNNLAEGVFLIRARDGIIVFTNPQFERMFGYGPGELVGKHVSVVNAPGDKRPEEVAKEINDELARRGVWSGEVHSIRKDGTTFWSHASASVLEHPQYGTVWVSAHEDISQRKVLEKETHERRREMDELQKLHVAAQTASAIAHELNQPLVAVTSYCRAALLMLKSEHPDFAEISNAIEGSERQAHRAGQSIRELFDFLNSNEFPVEDFDLVQEIVLILEDARKEHDLHFQSSLRVEEMLPPARANRTHIQKVLLNLLHNGIEAAMNEPNAPPPVITVTVRKARDGRMAEVAVHDNGPGLTRESAQHLFEPFFTTKGDGFGMGLTISRSLVEMNGGRLWADPHEGSGATFHLTIPLTDAGS